MTNDDPDRLSPARTLSDLRGCLRRSGIGLRSLLAPAGVSLGASLLDGASFALLIPLTRGLVDGDFRFLSDLPVLRRVAAAFPGALPDTNVGCIAFLVTATFLLTVAKLALQYLCALMVRLQVKRFASNLRTLVFARYLSFGKPYFDEHNPGCLHQTLTFHVYSIAGSLRSLHEALYASFTLVVYLALMASISWRLTLVVLVLFPVLHCSLRRLISRITSGSEDHTSAFFLLSKRISNAISGIPLVKAYGAETSEVERFARASEEVEAREFARDRRNLLVKPLQELILLAFLLVLLSVVAASVVAGNARNVPAYAVFLLVLRRSGGHIGAFNNLKADVATAAGPIASVVEVFDDREKHVVPDGTRNFAGLSREIRVRDLEFSYPRGSPALRGVRVTFCKGEATALVGRSGAGKSTLIHLLMRFYDPPPGAILVDGTDVRDLTVASWRSRIAYVGQDTLLFDGTLRENLTYSLDGEVSAARLEDVLERVSLRETVEKLPLRLETEVGDRGVMLSQGEKQRVSIARAILRDAEILLLDEATSSLDSRTERAVRDATVELMRGKTTIVIAHRLSTIQHADRIVVLEGGRVVEEGRFQDLVRARGTFLQYCREQHLDLDLAEKDGGPSGPERR